MWDLVFRDEGWRFDPGGGDTVAVSLGKKLTHTCFSRLRSINEYLVIDWGGHDRWLGSNIMQQMGTCGP